MPKADGSGAGTGVLPAHKRDMGPPLKRYDAAPRDAYPSYGATAQTRDYPDYSRGRSPPSRNGGGGYGAVAAAPRGRSYDDRPPAAPAPSSYDYDRRGGRDAGGYAGGGSGYTPRESGRGGGLGTDYPPRSTAAAPAPYDRSGYRETGYGGRGGDSYAGGGGGGGYAGSSAGSGYTTARAVDPIPPRYDSLRDTVGGYAGRDSGYGARDVGYTSRDRAPVATRSRSRSPPRAAYRDDYRAGGGGGGYAGGGSLAAPRADYGGGRSAGYDAPRGGYAADPYPTPPVPSSKYGTGYTDRGRDTGRSGSSSGRTPSYGAMPPPASRYPETSRDYRR